MQDTINITSIISTLTKDVLLYVPAQIVPLFISFIGLSIYTRLFTTAEYGDYSLILATLGIFGIFSYNWLNNANLRFYKYYNDSSKLNSFFSTTFFLLLAVLLINVLAYLALNAAGVFYSNVSNYALLTICALLSISFFETLMTMFRAGRKVLVNTILRCSSVICSFGISLVLITTFYRDISALLLGVIITNSILSVIIIISCKYYKYIKINCVSKKVLGELLGYGLPLTLTLLFSWITLMSNRYIIGYFKGTEEVGIYSVAVQLSDPLSIFSQFLLFAAYPLIIETWEQHGNQLTTELISKISKYYLVFAIPAFCGVLVLPDVIMSITGKSFSGGYIALPWICFGGLLLGLCYYVNKGLELKKNTRILAMLVGLMAMINVGLNFILVPMCGYLGAAITTSISYSIYFILSVFISKNYLEWKIPVKTVANSTVCSILMGLVLLSVKNYFAKSIFSLVVLVLLGAAIYALLIYISGELRAEVRYLKNLITVRQNQPRVRA